MAESSSTIAKRFSLRPEWRGNRLAFVASIKDTSANDTSDQKMDLQSPLTQQSRPDTFEPKIATLYRQLFTGEEDHEHTEGYWRELFLLKADVPRLRETIDEVSASYLLHDYHQPRQLLLEATAAVRSGNGPADEHALDTLTVFFSIVLAKRYTTPSSDIIDVLAGLDNVDAVFTQVVATLDNAIRDGRELSVQQKATRAAIALVAGGYQTALVSYFLQRDFFSASMTLIRTLDHPLRASEPLIFVGLLANYDKFETHNHYRSHFAEATDSEALQQVVEAVGWTSKLLRDRYVAVLDDTPATWSIGGTLSYVGLGALAGAKPVPPVLSEEQQKTLFVEQPGHEAAVTLAIYEFAMANKSFSQRFITAPAADKDLPTAFSAFLSYASYLFQHAFRTTRSSLYAYVVSFILLVLVEESTTAKLLCDQSATVRLCRQRPPHLPVPAKAERPYAAAIIDVLIDGMNHNLRKRMDAVFYNQNIILLSRLLNHLARSRTKLAYHWPELWRSLLAFVRFLTTYAEDLKSLPRTSDVVQHLVDLLTFALTNGESFLPDSASYDDLFYKLVESGEALTSLRTAYTLGKPDDHSSINTLIGVSKHYQELIEEHHKGKSTNLSPKEVSRIIKMGYETLSLEAKEGLEVGGRFREADWKAVLKRVARTAVADAAALVA